MDAPTSQGGSSKKKWPWWIVVLILCCLAGIAGSAYFYFSAQSKDTARLKPKVDRKEELLIPEDKVTVMIMGVDERHEDVGRSDTLMLATVDPVKHRVALLSIPRDTRVKIKGHGFDKINAAYAYGDEKLAQETVENFMGVHIDHYVIVNVASFVKIIDAMGGVDVNVKQRMYYEDPWDDDGGLLIDFQPGLQHMDGKKAVTYVRYRDEIGDAGRIERQQEFMRSCLAQLISPSTILRLPDVIREIVEAVKTDMTVQECLEIANALKELSPGSLKTEIVPGEYKYIGGVCYLLPDIKNLRKTIVDTLEVEVDARTRERFEQDTQEYEESVPESAVPAGIEPYYPPTYREPYRPSSEPAEPAAPKGTDGSDRLDSRNSTEEEQSIAGKASEKQGQEAVDEPRPAEAVEEVPMTERENVEQRPEPVPEAPEQTASPQAGEVPEDRAVGG